MSIKIDRLNNTFVEKISEIIHNDVKDSNVKFVTITDVRITNDLSFATLSKASSDSNSQCSAKIYINHFVDDFPQESLERCPLAFIDYAVALPEWLAMIGHNYFTASSLLYVFDAM